MNARNIHWLREFMAAEKGIPVETIKSPGGTGQTLETLVEVSGARLLLVVLVCILP